MSQAIAWGFVKRQLHADVMHAMEALIRASEPKAKIESVEVDLTRLDRHARLVYLPRYVLSYTWGERFNVSGERHKEMFQAIISGEKDHDFNVGAARHYSPVKASLLGAAAAASALAVLTLAEVLPPAYALGMDGLFATAIATCLSGFAAHAVQHASRSRAESGVAAQEERAFGAATATGFGPAAPARGQAEDALEAAEWARWALCGAAHSEWSPATRARWARELWAAQHRRRAQARRQVARAAAADAQEKRDAAREEARRARWGRSRHEERMERSRAAFEGMGRGRRASGRSGGHRLHDPLGYYALLGIASHGTNEPPSLRCIREGFRAAALKHHPDRLPHEAGAAERSRAARRFAQVSRAYQVLRNPATRARYDSGLPLH